MTMTQHRLPDDIQADIERAQAWRARWIQLANSQERMRRMGGFQFQMDFVIRRANAANRRVARLMDEIDAAVAALQGVSPVSPVSPQGAITPAWHLAEDMPQQPRGWYWAPFPGQWVFYSPELNAETGTFHGTTDWQPLAAKSYWGPWTPPAPESLTTGAH